MRFDDRASGSLLGQDSHWPRHREQDVLVNVSNTWEDDSACHGIDGDSGVVATGKDVSLESWSLVSLVPLRHVPH